MSAVPAGKPSHANDDNWQLRATEAAIAAARNVVAKDGINSRAQVGSLSDIEWGWVVAAAIFGWIKVRSQQAVAEGEHWDMPIRSMTYRDMEPWEIGAVEAVLPGLADLPGIDWSKPVGDWSKEDMARFVWRAHRLTDSALAARDNGAAGAVIKFSKEKAERELSASRGGSLMTQDELNDEIPF